MLHSKTKQSSKLLYIGKVIPDYFSLLSLEMSTPPLPHSPIFPYLC